MPAGCVGPGTFSSLCGGVTNHVANTWMGRFSSDGRYTRVTTVAILCVRGRSRGNAARARTQLNLPISHRRCLGFSMSLMFAEPRCASKVDLCFIIDSSGSIRDNNPSDGSYDNWLLQLEFLTSIVRAFTIGPDDTQVHCAFNLFVLHKEPGSTSTSTT